MHAVDDGREVAVAAVVVAEGRGVGVGADDGEAQAARGVQRQRPVAVDEQHDGLGGGAPGQAPVRRRVDDVGGDGGVRDAGRRVHEPEAEAGGQDAGEGARDVRGGEQALLHRRREGPEALAARRRAAAPAERHVGPRAQRVGGGLRLRTRVLVVRLDEADGF